MRVSALCLIYSDSSEIALFHEADERMGSYQNHIELNRTESSGERYSMDVSGTVRPYSALTFHGPQLNPARTASPYPQPGI